MAAAASYMPKGVNVDVVGYWFPADGRGPVANDTNVVLQSATNPVLAHLFLNYMLDLPNVLENISWNGYMQPLTGVTPQVLVKEQILPPTLVSTAVLPSDFRRGLFELQLPVDADALVAAGLARRQQRDLNGMRGWPCVSADKRNAFWIALATPGIIWLALLFIVPFYAVLAIAMGKLNQLYESPGRGLEPVELELGQRHRRLARPVRQRLVRRPDRGRARWSTWPSPHCSAW